MLRHTLATAAIVSLAACPMPDRPEVVSGDSAQVPEPAGEGAPGKETVQPPAAPERAPPESTRLSEAPSAGTLLERTRSWFDGHPGKRIHVQMDKPLYKPGETIWIKTWNLRARDFAPAQHSGAGITYELVSPKGAVVLIKRLQEQNGVATNDFEIPEGVQGGEYTLRARADDGTTEERPVVVSVYEAPRLKQKLEMVRKAYGAGDEVTATIQVRRPTGEPLADHTLQAIAWLDGQTIADFKLSTNAEGGGMVRFKLPAKIDRGDGLLTVLAEDGGVTESVSKRIPIIVKKLQLSFFPEGGQMIAGLPGRLYFEAKNPIGKPADVEGRVVDDHGNAVAKLSTLHAGLGRADFTPSTGRSYFAEITRPVGVTEKYPLPLAAEEGCALRTFDDFDGQLAELRVSVRCTRARKVSVIGMVRDNVIEVASVAVPEGEAAVVYLKPADAAAAGGQLQGVARVTVFDEELNPLAERLVYRGRRNRLQVEITPDKPRYTPREQVALTVRTSNGRGEPLPAELAVAVVDDTVVSFADDKTGHMLSRLFLEPEVPEKVEEPNFFFDLTKAKSAAAMDLLMGTRGWRKFEWQLVTAPPPPPMPELPTGAAVPALDEGGIGGLGLRGAGRGGGGIRVQRDALARRPVPKAAPPAEAKPLDAPPRAAPPAPVAVMAPPPPAPPPLAAAAPAKPMPAVGAKLERRLENARARGPAAEPEPMAGADIPMQDAEMEMKEGDKDWAGAANKNAEEVQAKEQAAWSWAPVRVFPAPQYRGDETGPRTDFRETVHWAPAVLTGKDGKATVTFYLSDSVTSFRVFAEGIGGGLAGRSEKVFESSLPFSMNVKLPLEVSAGDSFLLPLTLTNDRDKQVDVAIDSSFGDLLVLERGVQGESESGTAVLAGEPSMKTTVRAGERKSVFYPVTVKGTLGKSRIKVSADASGLKDEFIRELEVVPIGFPQVLSASGNLGARHPATFDLGEAIEGSVVATVKLYPSPVATMIGGLDGMLREPNGCFEQTSSTNYPNIMVLHYLRAHDVADPELIERASSLLDRGYKRLVGFETPNKGYEWFGQAPGHEALTGYGLLQFADLKKVYGGVDDQMMERTMAWIMSRRDGNGGFKRDPKALDSFGGAKPEVTNAYLVYAMAEAGFDGIQEEIEMQAKLAGSTADAYLLALATNTLLDVKSRSAEAAAAARRLAAMQDKNGSWHGADHSITRSTGVNLDIETTSLALLALMQAGGHEDRVRSGVEWLASQRSAFGSWSATQATILALKAMTEYANLSRKTPTPGELVVRVNGEIRARASYEAGRRDPLVLDGFGQHFTRGVNKIELVHDGQSELPFTVGVEFRTVKPANSPNVVVDLTTKLDKDEVPMGQNVRLTATIRNKTDSGQPMTIARIGLPGGLTSQTWQLKELKEKGVVAFTETRAREVIVYFRDMKPGEVKEVPLDLVATVPGEYTGPASSAYLYYSDDAKVWADGLKIAVTR